MRIQNIDILSDEVLNTADAIGFTSNGIVKKDGRLVMGAGVAKVFRDNVPNIDEEFGRLVKERGNVVCPSLYLVYLNSIGLWKKETPWIFNFPTKHHWRDGSDLKLIQDSAKHLIHWINHGEWKNVYLPAPGTLNGGLSWVIVKPAIENILDDRVIICFKS